MDQGDIPALLSRLASDEDAVRKMAVFKLQSSINDPAFADVFIATGGLQSLRRLVMGTGGNTLAYALQSLARLLEVDMGWTIFEGPQAGDLVERVVALVVTNPLVNILRGAMSILVALVGHSQSSAGAMHGVAPGTFGLRALKPAVAVHPQFFELVIQQLQSADHALCSSALMLINALIRDAVSSDPSGSTASTIKNNLDDWPKFIKRLQDLGLVKAVYAMMQSASLQDLVHPLLEFQSLTKVLLRKWREVRVETEVPEHRRGLKSLHLASAPIKPHTAATSPPPTATSSKRHNPEKWRRLGFSTESPAHDFDTAGYLGLMDLTEHVRKHEDGFQKLLLEQSARPLKERCPVARASLAVTMILYEHFDVDRSADDESAKGYQGLDGAKNLDRLFRPLLLQWARLHTAALQAFFRIWKSTGAEQDDFEKVAALVRILVGRVVGLAGRTKDILEVEDEMHEHDVARLRELQLDLLELGFEERWGAHIQHVREELRQEALHFVKEQRIRCLLQGSWFLQPTPRITAAAAPLRWRYAKLSPNRRHLYYADFAERAEFDPTLDSLLSRVDLGTISSVASSVSADDSRSVTSNATLKTSALATLAAGGQPPSSKRVSGGSNSGSTTTTTTKITIYSYDPASIPLPADNGAGSQTAQQPCAPKEEPVLTLYPNVPSLASEWLDGLLMLLNQAPITAETHKLVGLAREYGLKIRLLNVRLETAYAGPVPGGGEVPSREGLDEDYFYEM